MPERTWIKSLRDAFETLRDCLEFISSSKKLKENSKFYNNLKEFTLAVTSQNSKQSCSNMLNNFLQKEEYLNAVRKGIVVIDSKDVRSQGEIFKIKDAKLTIVYQNEALEQIVSECELTKLIPFFYFLIIGKADRASATPEEEKLFVEFEKGFNYFICSFAEAVGNYCLTAQIPTKEDAELIHRVNSVEIPSRPSHRNMGDRITEVFKLIGSDEVASGLLGSFVSPATLETLKSTFNSIDFIDLQRKAQKIQKDIIKGDGKAIYKTAGDVVSSITSNFETKEGDTKASEQEF